MTGINEVLCSGIGRVRRVFPCVWCSMITTVFVCLDNTCVVRFVLLRIKDSKILVKTLVYVKDRPHQAVEESNVWLVDGKDHGIAQF